MIDAVITPGSCNFLTIVRRVEALGKFLDSEDGKNLLAGTKRAANTSGCRREEGTAVAECRRPRLFREDAEKKLDAAVNQAEKEAGKRFRMKTFPPPCWRLARCVNQLIHSLNAFS